MLNNHILATVLSVCCPATTRLNTSEARNSRPFESVGLRVAHGTQHFRSTPGCSLSRVFLRTRRSSVTSMICPKGKISSKRGDVLGMVFPNKFGCVFRLPHVRGGAHSSGSGGQWPAEKNLWHVTPNIATNNKRLKSRVAARREWTLLESISTCLDVIKPF